MASANDIADAYWATVFEVRSAELWRDGVHPTFVDGSWNGVYVMHVGPSVRLRAPRHSRGVVEGLVRDASVDALMSRSLWSAGLAELLPTVLGPASHYLTDSQLDEGDQAHPLDPATRSRGAVSHGGVHATTTWNRSGSLNDWASGSTAPTSASA